MKISNFILGGTVAICLYLAYSVGHNQGLKAAPEYLAAKQLEDDRNDAFWEKMAELETPEDVVCTRIFEMVEDMRVPGDYDDRDPDQFQ
ncbi:hypothetical protein [Leisingera sp. M523]|uniref:hypothetical protein n=1 Tax=Leisingera sp. M523 TaxID=2867013 RepID=UPI0021A2DA8F|nr:hypothetical protein [Leisingera sp. M523]UWQ30272.1 hypothetical protein K3557_06965 [Leisingera sp. M523]